MDPDSNERPAKRARLVLPKKKENQYNDGTPKGPTKALQDLISKVTTLYKYSPLLPGEDIRVLVVGRGSRYSARTGEADPVVCRIETTALPSTVEDMRALGSDDPPKAIPYEALSYYWGLENATIPITIASYTPTPRRSMTNIVQKRFYIRPNLHAALIHLRDEVNEVRLWVDAICIHQDDLPEKTAQVARMHEIYSEASNVCVWLGVGEVTRNTDSPRVDRESTKLTFDFIVEMLSLKRLDQLVTSDSPEVANRWFSFAELMKNRWFSRRWVIQELALAKEATVHYGDQVMQWTDFADAVALFITKHDQINDIIKRHHPMDFDNIGDMRALGANTLVQASSQLFRRSNDGRVLERLMDLETLVSTLLAFEAKNPKDTVYAVLSIANDTPYSDSHTATGTVASAVSTPAGILVLGDRRITPNYEEAHTLADVFTDFVDYCVEKSDSLDIICRHWAPTTKERRRSITALTPDAHLTMPTWISPITGSAYGGPGLALQGRSNGDSLVGSTSRKHHKNYNASGSLKPKFKIERGSQNALQTTSSSLPDRQAPSYFENGHTGPNTQETPSSSSQDIPRQATCVLYAKGICLDTIQKLSPRAAQGMIFRECLEMGGWPHHAPIEKIPDSLWRTLVADRGPDGTNPPSWYRRACLECFTHVTQNGDLSTGALMENPSTPSIMKTFLKRVQHVVWNRKFLRSEEGKKNLFGLAPTTAEEGDLICILFGCSVPVILRKMTSPTGDDEYYYLVGEAYIHGMMDGEALGRDPLEFPYEGREDCIEFKIR